MKILVTGSSGHLGEALVRTLLNQQREVVGIDILKSPFTSHVGSIVDRAFIDACMRGVHTAYHAATLHKTHVATHSRHVLRLVEPGESSQFVNPLDPTGLRTIQLDRRPSCNSSSAPTHKRRAAIRHLHC